MTNVPTVSALEFIKFLKSKGFEADRQRGSHMTFRNYALRQSVTVPFHKGKDLPTGTFRQLLKQTGFEVEDFIAWRNS